MPCFFMRDERNQNENQSFSIVTFPPKHTHAEYPNGDYFECKNQYEEGNWCCGLNDEEVDYNE